MKIQNLTILFAFLIALSVVACDSKPRVIESEPASADVNGIPAFKDVPTVRDANSDEHKVVVEEALNTEKYTYLNVSENGEKFWIAISKREIKIGDTYYYRGGLLKKQFFSREFNRVFETLYLVSDFWKQPPGSGGESALDEALTRMQGGEVPDLEVGHIELAEGAIKISELVANKEKYNGKLVMVTGKCVKVNPMIMNRNWVHITDGSMDDFDLTVTTTENIPLGAVVSLEGTIALDKDFGAGYRYDIIMEGAVLR